MLKHLGDSFVKCISFDLFISRAYDYVEEYSSLCLMFEGMLIVLKMYNINKMDIK